MMSSSDAELLVSIHRCLLRAEDAAGSEWDLEKHQNLEPGWRGWGRRGSSLKLAFSRKKSMDEFSNKSDLAKEGFCELNTV